MLEAVGRAWRTWRAKARLVGPMRRPARGVSFASGLHFPELQEVLRANGPELPPYQGLAESWDDYVSPMLPDYAAFLPDLARRRGVTLNSILDIACGTGILTARLAGLADEVVGLDASEPMLAVARRRLADRPGVTLVQGDFRDFELDRQFDAAVCSSNSLNYVADRGELGRVFEAVARHLRPRGVFTFDTQTDLGMQELSGVTLHCTRGGRRFALQFRYDAKRRKEVTRTILPSGVETHRRIPLDPADVKTAAEGTGLSVEDYFFGALLPGSWSCGHFCFFVLAKTT